MILTNCTYVVGLTVILETYCSSGGPNLGEIYTLVRVIGCISSLSLKTN